MTLDILTERIMRVLAGGDVTDDFPWDPKDISSAIGTFRDEDIDLQYRINSGETKMLPGELLSTFVNIQPNKDSERDEYYLDIPVSWARLPKNRGLYQISLMKDRANALIPVGMGFESIYGKARAGHLEGNAAFYTEGKRIYLMGEIDPDMKFLIRAVAKTSDLPADMEIPMTSDMEARVMERVIAMFSNPQQDEINDNRP